MLYLPASSRNASPKAISGRTSYLLVRLAFHPYPHLIRSFCNRNRFGPPPAAKRVSPWTWVAHQVSCLMDATTRPLQTRFRFGSGCACLSLATSMNSPAHSPKGTRSDHPMSPSPVALPPSVSERFQVLFHSPHRGSFHLSLTVLVRYRSSSVFSLGGWSPLLPTRLACRVVLRLPARSPTPFAYGTLTPSGRPFQTLRLGFGSLPGWRLLPPTLPPRVWAAPLSLATTCRIVSFPRANEMFQFARFPPLAR